LAKEKKGHKPEADAVLWHIQARFLQHCGHADPLFLLIMDGIHARDTKRKGWVCFVKSIVSADVEQ
jgi:hypothetical protein